MAAADEAVGVKESERSVRRRTRNAEVGRRMEAQGAKGRSTRMDRE